MPNRWFHPLYLLALCLLLLNDFWWKAAWGNALTGKLSDFAGLLAFAWFWATLFPQWSKFSFLGTGIGFVWWKSAWASSFIFWLQEMGLPIDRVIDPTDLWALVILPFGFWAWQQYPFLFLKQWRPRWSVLLIAGVSLFAFSATTMVRRNTSMPPGDLELNLHYEIKLSPEAILAYLEEEGIVVEELPGLRDTIPYYSPSRPHYRIPEYITFYQDTVRNIHFSIEESEPNKSVLHLINLTLVKEWNLQSWQSMKDLHKIYKGHFKRHMIKPLRKSSRD